MRPARTAVTVLLLLASNAIAQKPIPIAPATPDQLTPDSTPIQSTPPTLILTPKTPAAHPGKVWIRSAKDGLHVWGEVTADQSTLRWPRQKSFLRSRRSLARRRRRRRPAPHRLGQPVRPQRVEVRRRLQRPVRHLHHQTGRPAQLRTLVR